MRAGKFKIELASPPDREKLVASILVEHQQWAEINAESETLLRDEFMNKSRKAVGKRLGERDLLYAPEGKFVLYEYTAEMMGDPDLTPEEYIFDTDSQALEFAEQHWRDRFCRYIIFDESREIGQVPEPWL
jgi:hypothetical protein